MTEAQKFLRTIQQAIRDKGYMNFHSFSLAA